MGTVFGDKLPTYDDLNILTVTMQDAAELIDNGLTGFTQSSYYLSRYVGVKIFGLHRFDS